MIATLIALGAGPATAQVAVVVTLPDPTDEAAVAALREQGVTFGGQIGPHLYVGSVPDAVPDAGALPAEVTVATMPPERKLRTLGVAAPEADGRVRVELTPAAGASAEAVRAALARLPVEVQPDLGPNKWIVRLRPEDLPTLAADPIVQLIFKAPPGGALDR